MLRAGIVPARHYKEALTIPLILERIRMSCDVTILEHPPKRLTGIFMRTSMDRAGEDCPKLWETFMAAVGALTGGHAYDAYGVSSDYDESGAFTYWATLDAPLNALSRPAWVPFLSPLPVQLDGALPVEVRGGLYAMATIPALSALPEAYAFLYGEWGRGQDAYALDMASPCFEYYPRTWREDDPFRLYVPVKKA